MEASSCKALHCQITPPDGHEKSTKENFLMWEWRVLPVTSGSRSLWWQFKAGGKALDVWDWSLVFSPHSWILTPLSALYQFPFSDHLHVEVLLRLESGEFSFKVHSRDQACVYFWNCPPYIPKTESFEVHSTSWPSFLAKRPWPGLLKSYGYRFQPGGTHGAHFVNSEAQHGVGEKGRNLEYRSLESDLGWRQNKSFVSKSEGDGGLPRKGTRRRPEWWKDLFPFGVHPFVKIHQTEYWTSVSYWM